ncbi:hypothetical protein BRADI_4g06055v3 [Brachypodium distachyon]|uniref:Uncharacterized protein n=1 Tax=Brachypodium distachyon TaxID=15368 RepID=A0A2K2CKS3_BRADI|nr:hypothetical protein BRADI_4g06055v3 [Brachypodium distachyon]
MDKKETRRCELLMWTKASAPLWLKTKASAPCTGHQNHNEASALPLFRAPDLSKHTLHLFV